METEKVYFSPSKGFSLLAPLTDKASTILDGLLPVGRIDVVGAAVFLFLECTT